MTISLRTARLIMAAGCECFALAISPFALSQAVPAAASQEHNAQSVPLTLAPNSTPPRKDSTSFTVDDWEAYGAFVEDVGHEDDRIKAETQEGKARIIGRRDYSSEIGIANGEEQAMLSIVLDTYRRENEAATQSMQGIKELLSQSGAGEKQRLIDREQATITKDRFADLKATWTELKTRLGEESFDKLDAFVYGHLQEMRGANDTASHESSPALRQSMDDNARVLKLSGWSHRAYPGAYDELIRTIGGVDSSNRRPTAKHQDSLFNFLPLGVPVEKREAVIVILLDAYHQTRENDKQFAEARDHYRKEHNYQVIPRPLPPEIQAVDDKSMPIVEQCAGRLRQELGDDSFNTFEKELNRSREGAAASSSSGASTERQKIDSPAVGKDPGAEP